MTRVSVHGGHSGEFCGHARDTLAEVVAEYARQGFDWVGITEHMPPASDRLVTEDERALGHDAASLRARFDAYFERCRELQREYAGRLRVFCAFEAEICSGSLDLAEGLIARHAPDYVVGSVHHIDDVLIDDKREDFEALATAHGGVDALYCAYFDAQLELIERLRPGVVGHFDLVRMFDSDYRTRLLAPDVWQRVERNLDAIAADGLALDFNVRALEKGQSEPYVCEPILRAAVKRGISLVTGDDSHAVDGVGRNLDVGQRILARENARTDWMPQPG